MNGMDEYKDPAETENTSEEDMNPGVEKTRAIPATREPEEPSPEAGDATPRRRRRRSERYAETETEEESGTETPRYTSAPVIGTESATAREAAERMGLRPEREAASAPDPLAGSRIPPQAAAWNRARTTAGSTSRQGMSEASRVRMAEGRRERTGGNEGGAYGQSSENVGYASGRMSAGNPAMAAAARARMEAQRAAGSPSLRKDDGGRGVPPKDNRYVFPEEEGGRKKHRWMIILLIVLLLIGLLIVGLLAIPEDAGGIPGDIKRAVVSLIGGKKAEENADGIVSFSASGYENSVAPTDVTFSIKTLKTVTDIRLVDEDKAVITCSRMTGNNTDQNLWTLTWHLEDGYEGAVSLQAFIGEEWKDTEKQISVSVASLPQITTGQPEAESTAAPEELKGDERETPENLQANAQSTVPPDLPGIIPEDIDPEDLGGEDAPEDVPEDVPGEGKNEGGADEPDVDPEGGDAEEQPLNNLPADKEPGEESTPAPEGQEEAGAEATAEPTPEVTSEPKLVVSACEEADPDALIAQAVIYNGTKKASEYNRAEKDLITMPVVGEYTRKASMGVLTYRGDAFRQNPVYGTVKSAGGLIQEWQAEAGSIKGSGQTYYGIGWTGQPAIVKWSKEVREKSEMYDSKKEKTGLKEVIIGGLDGHIYFLDLADGTLTRNSIKLGYPMKGSPSVHPGGAPYMNIGQYARKMANGTGKIGLRQYNLYTTKEMTLIDGLDGKTRRPFNDVGSFETSALMDRTSDTLITAGTNGMLYVINMGSTFDYQIGNYVQSPAQVALKTKAKGESDKQTAVEASVAMYDRYVYYADMGGILRCVDTNTMKTAWAVKLDDAVESTPALDLVGEDGLNLFTATILSNRKSGDASVSCYDALSGARKWTTAFPVKKDTKNKTVSGFRASPVVGQNKLEKLVYYTVNNLNEDGRMILGLGEETAAVAAMYKDTGTIAWVKGLSGLGYSSPVAVYDADGNGWIIQCSGDGTILLLDGLTGAVVGSLEVDGDIEASPAVYNDMMVIATTKKGANFIYGIRIQ